MDIDDLRDALKQENQKRIEPEPAAPEIADDLARLIRIQAEKITARFTEATDTGERNRLQDRYQKLELWMKQLRKIERLKDAERETSRSALRAAILEDISKWNLGGEQHRAREEEIETGRKRLVEHARPGALQHAHKRIRDEINYLIKNYTPSNDYKIEALIDKWRTSGDPSYDPTIRLQLRKARRKKSESDYAL
jgi:hypothetical protein